MPCGMSVEVSVVSLRDRAAHEALQVCDPEETATRGQRE